MSGDKQDNGGPFPKFSFKLKIGDIEIPFQEVSGLETELQTPDYRQSGNSTISHLTMPGLNIGLVVLKNGIFTEYDGFWEWFNKIGRRTIVINYIDVFGATRITWALNNACPNKITGIDRKSFDNEIAVEAIEIAHRGITVTKL